MKSMKLDDTSIVFERDDGVTINGRTNHPNGNHIKDAKGNNAWHVTAHNELWASVPVGYFTDVCDDIIVAGANFIMPK
jgi:hypothetical protein